MLPMWTEQERVLEVVAARAEKQLQKQSADIELLLMERAQIEKLYDEKYDALVRCLSQEQENAVARVLDKKRELARSFKLEDETAKALVAEEQRITELQFTFNQTKRQLDSVVQDLQDIQAESVQQTEDTPSSPLQVPSEVDVSRGKVETLLKEKDFSFSERQATEADIKKAACELEQQRDHAAKLEDFIRRLLQGDSGHLLDASMKKDASSLLSTAAKLQRPANLCQSKQDVVMGARLVSAA